MPDTLTLLRSQIADLRWEVAELESLVRHSWWLRQVEVKQ